MPSANRWFTCLLLLVGLNACNNSSPDIETDPNTPPEVTDSVTGSATLKIISNRPDLVSGGDVLVEVVLDSPEALNNLQLTLAGSDVTNVLEPTAENELRLLGVVSGMSLGNNPIDINLDDEPAVTVINHPIHGPVFTGPHIEPWQCQSSAADDKCNQAVEYELLYRSTTPGNTDFNAYDPDNAPSDVAMTTTENGETIPFIVRKEIGYLARDQYNIFNLVKLDEDWTPANPQSQWNQRLLVTHGGNCRGDHSTDAPRTSDYAGTIPSNPAVANSYVTALGMGWGVLSTAQLNLGHNCNLSYQAESLMMAKERFIEQYGELRYTVGTGCSGGAITQNMIANAYPGLYQGILTTCTYPDVMSTATQFADYHILLRYFEATVTAPAAPDDFDSFIQTTENLANTAVTANTARDGTNYTTDQQNAIYGHPNGIVNASLADSALFSEAVNPQSNCGGIPPTVAGDPSTRYHPDTNTAGVRCDVLTFMLNMVGPRDEFDPNNNPTWSTNENDLGYGFGGYPLGNLGVQYGLEAMKKGFETLDDGTTSITPDQFIAINSNIGALDTDLNLTEDRLQPDYPALTNAFRTGILNTGTNIDTVAIINMTGPDPGAAHDSLHGYWLRRRIERNFGNRDNFVHWGGATVLIGNPNYMNESLIAMRDWLDAVEADTSDAPLAEKIVTNKPDSVADQCEGAPGMCSDQAMAVYGTPRTVAGEGVGDNIEYGNQMQCSLKEFSRDDPDYALVKTLWDADPENTWEKLETAFTTDFVDGNPAPYVCDWSKPPLGWQPTIPWLIYQDLLGNMITGGTQMEPADFPTGWASPAFNQAWTPSWQVTQN